MEGDKCESKATGDRTKVDEEVLHVRKFGDAVNSGQAMRYRDINVVWSSFLKRRSGEIYFVGTVTKCSRICRMYVYTARQSTYVTLSRLYPSI